MITLGIIGVVAALTMPSLIQNHRNHVVETRLKKVYSTMNQAIQLAEIDYGDREYWGNSYLANTGDLDTDKNGKPLKGVTLREKWLNKYLVPYIKGSYTAYYEDRYYKGPYLYFQDGSALILSHEWTMRDWMYSTGNPKKGLRYGVSAFQFFYSPESTNEVSSARNFEPDKYGWDGDLTTLKAGCYDFTAPSYCTAVIQYNGWKIPNDYPYKVKY